MDFMSDKLADGRSFRILTVMDQVTRECVCLEADRAMTGMQVAQALERTKVERGKLPASITMDNGTEFCSRALEAWVMANDSCVSFGRGDRPLKLSMNPFSTADGYRYFAIQKSLVFQLLEHGEVNCSHGGSDLRNVI
jgi:transposase InsO family protein